MVQKARIISTGSYLPERVLSNNDLEKMVDTSDEWIISRTGMKERRLAAADEPTSEMGFQAAKKAIEKAGIKLEKIELILFATLTPDYPFPSTACLIQARLRDFFEQTGQTKDFNPAAVDLQAACTGYIYALSQAKAYIESGMYRSILIVASEKLSSIVNYQDRSTCVLFGDGAAACIVAAEGKGLFISDVCLGADGRLAELLIIPAGGSKKPASMETIQANQHYLQMEGKELFKHAVRRMEMAASCCLERASLKKEQIKWLIPHQANIRIIEAIAKRFDVPMEHVFLTLHKYGNTSASSVGIALDELLQEKDLREEDHILLVAFGAGLTWGAAILTCGAENA
ncbi:beta-ketoacyl-ACP synthase III [Candidatus Rhabdochlamydia porcellionis]|uniref:Beta-ketoacyl-[acyl-carrier-protein] synthase III n=1 Tax=Candidatus Rhabdochlamydia porcellionis TaxID=225148 RepID=A0ABX8YZW3_9BACT|nr:beta-ketoacyl-ACP synthase III [Candidatus Rhabdochlamydia porcellionis]QZA58924.1 3-oxoacyl-[acyl-carrier-protein] synthase 3 [Candidatus Rhabdochlamydia porcellionis]